MEFNGPSAFTQSIALTTGDPRCSTATGPLVCTISVALMPGNYSGTFTTYDQAPISGAIPGNANMLSTGASNFAIALGKANVAKVTLDGVPSSFTLTMPSAPANVAFVSPQTFQVNVLDADGYTIAGTYTQPVQLTDEDTTGCTTIATSGSDNPTSGVLLSSSDIATINYNGNPFGYATISASAIGATTGTGVFKVTVPPFDYTGGSQSYTVPPGVTRITINALGASGTYFEGSFGAGLGASVTASYSVAPGEVLDVEVGGAGGNIYGTNKGGYNGGGDPGGPGGGAGGGASDVRQSPYGLADRLIVAGGGGGDGYGTAGYVIFGGNAGVNGDAGQAAGGGGGTGAAGGAGGGNGSSGQLGIGGNGGVAVHPGIGGGGGGGGAYGGGGGAGVANSPSGAGGGGSSGAGGVPGAVFVSGVQNGNGQVTISY